MGYVIMILRTLLAIPAFLVLTKAHAQTDTSDSLLGVWTFLTTSETYHQTYSFHKDGTFLMHWTIPGEVDGESHGTYAIKDQTIALHYDDGKKIYIRHRGVE